MNPTRKLKQWFRLLECTPLHPQWLVLRHRGNTAPWIKQHAYGTLVDVGCGNSWLRKQLPDSVHYIGIDYPATMALGYSGNPDILADASKLPIRTASCDTVILLDVLEHLTDPEGAVAEASRILSHEGKCLIHVPFLYPLHDEPHDYQRWTRYGLQRMLAKHGFEAKEIVESTSPMETAAALLSIALAKEILGAIQQRSSALLLAPLILILVPVLNLIGWLLAKLMPASRFMSFSYHVVASIVKADCLTEHIRTNK